MNTATTRVIAQPVSLPTPVIPVINLSRPAGLLSALILSVVISAFSVLTLSDNHREITGMLASLQQEHSQLETRYGQLLLEENTLASPTRVEKIAKQQDGMVFPTAQQVVIISQ